MKKELILLILLIPLLVLGQNINQFDSENNRHGVWKKYFDGTKQLRYEGQFSHGKEVGLFKFYKLHKRKSYLTATKQFNENDNMAYVTFLSIIGKKISEGKMNGKLYVGEWVYYHKNSSKVMTLENYNDDGQLHGEKKVFYDNEVLAELSIFKNGKLQGKATYYSENGALIKEYMYEDGELHGWSKHYDDLTGKVLVEGMYKKGKKAGNWKYYLNGKLVKEKNMDYVPKRKMK